jgi:hypothetical protein
VRNAKNRPAVGDLGMSSYGLVGRKQSLTCPPCRAVPAIVAWRPAETCWRRVLCVAVYRSRVPSPVPSFVCRDEVPWSAWTHVSG